jgi:hypothetical protein
MSIDPVSIKAAASGPWSEPSVAAYVKKRERGALKMDSPRF